MYALQIKMSQRQFDSFKSPINYVSVRDDKFLEFRYKFRILENTSGFSSTHCSVSLREDMMILACAVAEESSYQTVKEFWKSVQWFSSLFGTNKHTNIQIYAQAVSICSKTSNTC
jgi:hypothetical protein